MATAESFNEEGIRLHRAGKHAEALAAFDAACRAEPHDPKLWFNRGNVLFMTGSFAPALQSFSEALRLDGLLAPAWMMGAGCHAELGAFDMALQWIEKALSLDAALADAWNNPWAARTRPVPSWRAPRRSRRQGGGLDEARRLPRRPGRARGGAALLRQVGRPRRVDHLPLEQPGRGPQPP